MPKYRIAAAWSPSSSQLAFLVMSLAHTPGSSTGAGPLSSAVAKHPLSVCLPFVRSVRDCFLPQLGKPCSGAPHSMGLSAELQKLCRAVLLLKAKAHRGPFFYYLVQCNLRSTITREESQFVPLYLDLRCKFRAMTEDLEVLA